MNRTYLYTSSRCYYYKVSSKSNRIQFDSQDVYIFSIQKCPWLCKTNYYGKLFLGPQAISYAVGFRQLKTALFDWILLVLLLIVSRVDFIVFVLFLEAVGVREYCCTAVEIGW